jgi:hypothetical protein
MSDRWLSLIGLVLGRGSVSTAVSAQNARLMQPPGHSGTVTGGRGLPAACPARPHGLRALARDPPRSHGQLFWCLTPGRRKGPPRIAGPLLGPQPGKAASTRGDPPSSCCSSTSGDGKDRPECRVGQTDRLAFSSLAKLSLYRACCVCCLSNSLHLKLLAQKPLNL